ncbi:hypothetical protein V6N13_074281 [Hibiscus sabdariffa]|uniref:Uncharacterized protein n=1 Tax=Hibiscus sabdariffa TaxID=183260 RepID=A0ABR2U804_9ROSI
MMSTLDVQSVQTDITLQDPIPKDKRESVKENHSTQREEDKRQPKWEQRRMKPTPDKGNFSLLPSIFTLRHADSPFIIRRGIRPMGIPIGTSPLDFAHRRSRHNPKAMKKDPSKAAGDITKPKDVYCKEEFVEIFPEPQSSLPD